MDGENYAFPQDYDEFMVYLLSADPTAVDDGGTDTEFFERSFHGFISFLQCRIDNKEKLDFRDYLLLMHGIFYFKGLVYGDSHRKHGELVSVFANVSRKYDRLENIMTKDAPEGAETRAETICDLAVYCVLWLEFLGDEHTEAMGKFLEKIKRDVISEDGCY